MLLLTHNPHPVLTNGGYINAPEGCMYWALYAKTETGIRRIGFTISEEMILTDKGWRYAPERVLLRGPGGRVVVPARLLHKPQE